MLSRREHQSWFLQAHENREYQTEAEKRFFEAIENPPDPTEKLKEIVRDYGKYASQK
jgi:uncharacterized protein (DUF1778 family)